MTHRLRSASLAAKLGTVGALLMVLALGSIALTLWVTWQLEGGAAAVNEAGRLRMQGWRMAQAVTAGDTARARELAAQFDDSLALLRAGDPARPLFVPADEATLQAFAHVQQNWAALRAGWQRSGGRPAGEAAAEAEALVLGIDRFVSGIESRLSRWTALLTLAQLLLLGLAIAAAIALLYAAHLFIFRPLAALQAGLGAVEQGDLSARVEVASADEFGRVGEGFNRMAARLADLYRGLERKVAEKTEKLSAERERLAVLYEASRFVARAPTMQALADGFARRVRQAARADAALLRWNDGPHRQFVLLASDAVPPEMLALEQCLAHGQCHCGVGGGVGAGEPVAEGTDRTLSIAATGSRVIAIASGDARGRHCRTFGFSHVLTVPVCLQDQILGEVDLLYRGAVPERSPEDQALVESLASHLASGMEGMRVAALEREAAVSEERGLLARELHDSIAQSLAFMKIQIQLLRGSLRKGDAVQTERVVQELDTGVRESMADVRELLLHFRTRAQGDDIVVALKTTLQKFHHQTGLATHIDVQGHGVPLAPDVQVQALHVVLEALSNVRKHAGASQVWLTVQRHPRWRIEVRDDGHGFDPAARSADEAHVGLRIMRERAAGVGAEVEVQSAAGQGTRVVLQWPEAQPLAA
ncbi:MAG: type IV pili methyl-accepting chemotaxis transducer N-terminal domain-containing protein [Burkholderiales bacterium]|nr:type IV pili methyl-accepting chemotaxis transducer N-terminal domain-containing protein [Burkholderiales bacterium]